MTLFGSTAAMPSVVIGPLTTTFTPPAYCTRPYQATNRDAGPYYSNIFREMSCSDTTLAFNTNCWPPGTSDFVMETAEVGISGVYSPGLVCPDGYVTACSATMLSNDPTLTASPSEAFPFLNPIRPGETAVGCCPIGFACVTTTPSPADDWVYQTCISTASQEPLDMIYCGSWQGIATATLNVSATRTKNMALRSSAVLAGMLQLNWQASDRSTSTPLQIKTITTAPAPTATGLLPSSSDDHPARLSTEAKVAIGAVAPVMFLAFIVSLIFMFRRRRRRQLNPSDTPIDYSKPELDGSWPAEWVRRDQQAVELPEENERYELEDNERSHESGPTIYYELPA